MADNGQDQASRTPHVVIVGGGISGLAAAFFLKDKPVRVTVLEGASRIGGKLSVSEVAGVPVDESAESTYVPRVSAGLIPAAGLGDKLVGCGTRARGIWTRGKLRPLPSQHMGVPLDMDELATSGVLSGEGLARARQDLDLPPLERDGDVSVAAFAGGRFGQEVVDRMVDPWLCGVYAGRSEELSFEATQAALATASRKYPSLTQAANSVAPQRPVGDDSYLGISTIVGGIGTLPPALAEAVLAGSPGASVRTGATVTDLTRTENGWRLTVSSAAGRGHIAADAVIIAVPAAPASRLLAGVPGAAPAAAALAEIPYVKTATITLAYPRQAFPGGLAERGLSGYVVPAVDGRAVHEVIFSTVKWPHLAGEVEIASCSVGRAGAEEVLLRDDADLAALAAAELAEATGAAGDPVATRVTRWDDALPQYTVGHLDRVARIRAAVAAQPGLAVCGAAYDGVGIGLCSATARTAAGQVLKSLRENTGDRQAVRA